MRIVLNANGGIMSFMLIHHLELLLIALVEFLPSFQQLIEQDEVVVVERC